MALSIKAQPISQALARAAERGLMPTALGTAQIRDQVAQQIVRNAVFSARTTNAFYVQFLKAAVERLLQGGRGNDWPQIRLELRMLLQRLGYTPEKGFPGDAARGVPPAEPGSLRDLSSDLRLNLILKTQEELMRGAALRARGLDGSRVDQFPAWELVRLIPRQVPRGSRDSRTKGWPQRFVEAGGELRKGRMIALKTDPVWDALGDSSTFSDALDVSHPPFAFNSGMGWREIHWREARELLDVPSPSQVARKPELAQKVPAIKPDAVIPKSKVSVRGLDDSRRARLEAALRKSEARYGVITSATVFAMGGPVDA